MSKKRSFLFSKWEKSSKKTSIKANSFPGILAPVIFTLGFSSLASAKTWREEPEGTIGVKVGFTSPSLSHEFKSKDPNITSFPKYNPYVPSRIFTEVNYSYFAASLSAPTATNENENTFFGNTTKFMDYQFRIYMNQHNVEAFLQEYEGFYLANSEAFDTTKNSGSPRTQRDDLKTTHYGFQYIYTLDSENYSLGSSFSQTTIQTESGGSWLALGGVNQKGISADSPLIPASAAAQYGELQDFKGGHFTTIKAGFGYGYNLVYEHFYIAGAILLALSQQQQSYKLGSNTINAWRPANGGNFKLGVGYNGVKFHLGVQLMADSDTISLGGAEDSITTGNSAFFLAYRFDSK